MKLYFYASSETIHDKIVSGLKILLKSKGIVVTASGDGDVLLKRIQLLIIEASQPNPQVAFLIASALAHRKPILILLARGTPLDLHLRTLQRDKTVGRWLRVEFYQDKNLLKLVENFVDRWTRGVGRELPLIKFTLRLTSTLDRYLTWKGLQVRKTRANFLRQIVEEMADGDRRFQSQLKKELQKY